ncbi:MAG: hypothetical protein P4M13_08460 [Alphaproteobacteria bacterium]|nr:hypothetical protein [Alphaproteobacteria bacterium]
MEFFVIPEKSLFLPFLAKNAILSGIPFVFFLFSRILKGTGAIEIRKTGKAFHPRPNNRKNPPLYEISLDTPLRIVYNTPTFERTRLFRSVPVGYRRQGIAGAIQTGLIPPLASARFVKGSALLYLCEALLKELEDKDTKQDQNHHLISLGLGYSKPMPRRGWNPTAFVSPLFPTRKNGFTYVLALL